jgi:hypothetical protein
MNMKIPPGWRVTVVVLFVYAAGTVVYFGYQFLVGLDPTSCGAVADARDLPVFGDELYPLSKSGPWLWILHGREPRFWLLVSVHCSEDAVRRFATDHKLGELGFPNNDSRQNWEAEVRQFRDVAAGNAMTAIPSNFDQDDLYAIAGDYGSGEIELGYRRTDGTLVMFIAK